MDAGLSLIELIKALVRPGSMAATAKSGPLQEGYEEGGPSTIFALACIHEKAPFVLRQQLPAKHLVIDLASREKLHIGGDDFKSGQTKVKSILVDFLVNLGIKPLAITFYNHLGNTDGKDLTVPQQFSSKKISKSNVVDDMVAANPILYNKGSTPAILRLSSMPLRLIGKSALDQYVSEIFIGRNTISLCNVCEDSLFASSLIIDLAIVTELITRIGYKTDDIEEYTPLHAVLSVLRYMLEAPMVPPGTPVVNPLAKHRVAIGGHLYGLCGVAAAE
ncbi:Myo-inositol-1-phosphate synthase [Rhizophlyctis rosea]|uniref:inositol-3-phosphate synthase n=1 Tax=Rhizophlyctis rosea TaxID=64517 RepID=A0AAD5S2P1_9FUNG|nr:Myo-inositol-1-phosphate synthase [Rhizophlyctis rosea]